MHDGMLSPRIARRYHLYRQETPVFCVRICPTSVSVGRGRGDQYPHASVMAQDRHAELRLSFRFLERILIGVPVVLEQSYKAWHYCSPATGTPSWTAA